MSIPICADESADDSTDVQLDMSQTILRAYAKLTSPTVSTICHRVSTRVSKSQIGWHLTASDRREVRGDSSDAICSGLPDIMYVIGVGLVRAGWIKVFVFVCVRSGTSCQ